MVSMIGLAFPSGSTHGNYVTCSPLLSSRVIVMAGATRVAPRQLSSSRRWSVLLRLFGLDRILDVREGGEFDIVEFAVLLLDLTNIDVLDDVAGIRIDR